MLEMGVTIQVGDESALKFHPSDMFYFLASIGNHQEAVVIRVKSCRHQRQYFFQIVLFYQPSAKHPQTFFMQGHQVALYQQASVS